VDQGSHCTSDPYHSDVNKDLTLKAKDKDQTFKAKDKDQTPKDKDQTFKVKDRTRTRSIIINTELN